MARREDGPIGARFPPPKRRFAAAEIGAVRVLAHTTNMPIAGVCDPAATGSAQSQMKRTAQTAIQIVGVLPSAWRRTWRFLLAPPRTYH